MDLNDARAFVIPRGKYNGQTIQAVASGHLDDVREMLEDEKSGTDFQDALEAFVSWTDSEPQDNADVPPEPEELVEGELDENGDLADREAYEKE